MGLVTDLYVYATSYTQVVSGQDAHSLHLLNVINYHFSILYL